MKNKFSTLSLFLTAAALSLTGSLAAALSIPFAADTSGVQLGIGYRQDSITWNVKERGTLNPRSHVNLHFKDLEIVLIDAKVKSTLGGCCDSYVRVNADYGWIFDGKCREKLEVNKRGHRHTHDFRHGGYIEKGDYFELVLHNDVKNGNSFVWDVDVGFAYPVEWGCEDGRSNFKFAPAIGFALNSQHIRVKDRLNLRHAVTQNECSDFDLSGSRGGNSKFRTQMWGPWVGFDFTYNTDSCWNMYGEFEMHFGRARRHRDSDLGKKYFDNYSRTKFFWGPSIKVGADYVFCENWYADTSISYSKYFSDANRDNFDWASASIRFDLGYLF